MRQYIFKFLAVLIFFSIFYIGCTPRAKYEHRLKKELASGVRYDSLFMGLYLGMPQKDFYTHCWQLNKMGLVKQGMRNTTVEYQIKKELKYPAAMNFYPSFVNNKIAEMPVQFTYAGWAPWNKSLSADSLQYDILRWFRIMYGDGFIKIRHPQKGLAYVKIDGNRRITIFKENELNVWAVFSDMTVLKTAVDTSVIGDLPGSDTTKSTR
jgi:hypothetical protein